MSLCPCGANWEELPSCVLPLRGEIWAFILGATLRWRLSELPAVCECPPEAHTTVVYHREQGGNEDWAIDTEGRREGWRGGERERKMGGWWRDTEKGSKRRYRGREGWRGREREMGGRIERYTGRKQEKREEEGESTTARRREMRVTEWWKGRNWERKRGRVGVRKWERGRVWVSVWSLFMIFICVTDLSSLSLWSTVPHSSLGY